MEKPPSIPQDLWPVLTQDEKSTVAKQDGGFLGYVGNGPWKCHYFTLWNEDGKPFAIYDKTSSGWVRGSFPNPA